MVFPQNHIKKVPMIDEKSTPEGRAERLRRLRNLANLTRKQLCDKGNININTLKGWEIGRYGGLPLDGAKKIIENIAQEGVRCTLDWLLYEKGPGPELVTNQPFEKCTSLKTDEIILSEIDLFREHYKNIMHLCIVDDGMLPTYQIGNYVAGVKVEGTKLASLINQDCIVEMKNGDILLRRLCAGSEDGKFTLLCNNLGTQLVESLIYNVEIVCGALIERHYKNTS